MLRTLVSAFEAGLNVDDRLAFAEVGSSGACLDAPMEESYRAFGLDPAETTTLETYLKEYYDTIMRRLRQMQADLSKEDPQASPLLTRWLWGAMQPTINCRGVVNALDVLMAAHHHEHVVGAEDHGCWWVEPAGPPGYQPPARSPDNPCAG